MTPAQELQGSAQIRRKQVKKRKFASQFAAVILALTFESVKITEWCGAFKKEKMLSLRCTLPCLSLVLSLTVAYLSIRPTFVLIRLNQEKQKGSPRFMYT